MAQNGPGGYGHDSGMSDMTVGDYANGMPNIRIGEMLRLLMRQLPWILILTVIGAALAFYATKDIKRTYEGVATIFVRQGPEHTMSSMNGEQGQAVMQDIGAITGTEVALLTSNEVIEAAIGQVVTKYGETRFDKAAFAEIQKAERAGDAEALANARVQLFKSIEQSLWATPQTKTSIIDLGYKHEDGEIAVETLKAIIENYLSFRRRVFVDGTQDVFAQRQEATEQQLNEVETKIQSFLRRNGLSDYGSERTGATTRTEDLRAQLNTARSDMAEAEAALASVENRLRQTDQQIVTRIDDRASQRVAQAETELKQLLAKYLPASTPVRSKQAEIASLRALQAENGGKPRGGTQYGPNPTYQALLADRNRLQASADSYREKEFTLQRLLNTADSKVKKLQRLSPQYNDLLRQRETLDQRLSFYTNKLQEARVNQEQAEAADSENVQVISSPTLPQKGRNMKKILRALIIVGWVFTLMMIALLKVFLDPRLYSDPTRRMRPRPGYRRQGDDGAAGNDQDIPQRQVSHPYVPEAVPAQPVPMQPAAAQHPQAYAAQEYQPHQQHPAQHHQAAYAATPYVGSSGAAYDMNANPYHPPVQAPQFQSGPLPSSESDQ